MKTTFSSGVIVTSQWLNGAKNITFDGQDLDWHYSPLGLSSLVTAGPDGLDSRYITLSTSQPNLEGSEYVGGLDISGTKVVSGVWNFGYNPVENPNKTNIRQNAPKSWTTNDKYNNPSGTIAQKFANNLQNEDLITKLILKDQIEELLNNLVVDNGIYFSEENPTCSNYGTIDTAICPL